MIDLPMATQDGEQQDAQAVIQAISILDNLSKKKGGGPQQ